MPFTEDLAAFFQTGDFATAATWSERADPVNGIFDREYALQLNLVDGSSPVFLCAEADMPSAARGQTLVINGTTYRINDVRPDGTGVLAVQLSL